MANPASAFPSLFDPLSQAYSGSLPPMIEASPELSDVVPAQRIPEMSALQDQVIQRILMTLQEDPPKRKWNENLASFFTKDPESNRERAYKLRQQQAMSSIQMLNAMTGMDRLGLAGERNQIAWQNLNQREYSNMLAAMREGRLQQGSPIKIETSDDAGNPMTLVGRLRPDSTIALPDGSTISPAAFPKPYRLEFLTGAQGFGAVNPFTGGMQGTVQQPGGEPFMPMPPAGITGSIAAGTATLGGLEEVWRGYQDIRGKTSDQTPMGKWLRTLGVEKFRAMSALFPDYANYIAQRRAALNAYIKSVTGAQFSIAELQRYEGMFPEPWDPENVAQTKLRVLKDRVTADMEAKIRAYPGAAPASPAAPTSGIPDHLKQFIEPD